MALCHKFFWNIIVNASRIFYHLPSHPTSTKHIQFLKGNHQNYKLVNTSIFLSKVPVLVLSIYNTTSESVDGCKEIIFFKIGQTEVN